MDVVSPSSGSSHGVWGWHCHAQSLGPRSSGDTWVLCRAVGTECLPRAGPGRAPGTRAGKQARRLRPEGGVEAEGREAGGPP